MPINLDFSACQVLLQVTEVSVASLAVDFTAIDPQLVLEQEPLTMVSEAILICTGYK